LTDFLIILKQQMSQNLFSGSSRVVPWGQTEGRTDRRTDMTKLRIAFHNFANAPKKQKDLVSHIFSITSVVPHYCKAYKHCSADTAGTEKCFI